MEKIKSLPLSSSLEIERAITQSERRRLLDAADLLLVVGGLSKNRRLAKKTKRKNYRAYRNRAIVYTLIETGMRRQAITKIDLHEIDFDKRTIQVEEKGGAQHKYHISREGIEAIQDYIKEEREQDSENWKSPALFLKSFTNNYNDGRLAVWTINSLWNNVCEKAGVVGKTPHSARHAMGRHIIQKTGNVAAVQRQLGHKNAAYSMQYSRITSKEMQDVLDKR